MLRDPENAGHPDLRPGNPPAETARRSRQTAPGARNSDCYRRMRNFFHHLRPHQGCFASTKSEQIRLIRLWLRPRYFRPAKYLNKFGIVPGLFVSL